MHVIKGWGCQLLDVLPLVILRAYLPRGRVKLQPARGMGRGIPYKAIKLILRQDR